MISRSRLAPICFICVAFAAPAPAPAAVPKAPFRVVIDPGHGGTDHGTLFNDGRTRITEKEITLLLAQSAAKRLRARGFEVTLTRQGDHEVSLARRTALANKLKADVFLSIHMNSTTSWRRAAEAQGVETFILNNTSDASSRRLARLENSVLGDSRATDSPRQMDVALILKDLVLDANLAESKRLACSVQRNLVGATSPPGTTRTRDRGVKQALFHVLLGADMPSILLEAGFLTHPKDRALVLSPAGRLRMGEAIASSVDQFRRQRGTRAALSELGRCKVH